MDPLDDQYTTPGPDSVPGEVLDASADPEDVGADAVRRDVAGDQHPPEARPIERQDPAPTAQETINLIHAFLHEFGPIKHADSYNELVLKGLAQIMGDYFRLDSKFGAVRAGREAAAAREVLSFRVQVQFSDVELGEPYDIDYLTGAKIVQLPADARRQRKTYAGDLRMSAEVRVTAYMRNSTQEVKTVKVSNVVISRFPVMVRSVRCHLRNASRPALANLQEDPTDPGGYFIVTGTEYVVSLHDNIAYNKPHYHRKVTESEHVRMEYISQPGDVFENSSQVRVYYFCSGQLVVELQSTKFEKLRIPLCILYRLLGMSSDRDIVAHLRGPGNDHDPNTATIEDIVTRAFATADATWAPYMNLLDQVQLVERVAAIIVSQAASRRHVPASDDEARRLAGDLLQYMDTSFLPHLGQGRDDRWLKLRYLGVVVREMLLVHLGTSPPTDRHHCSNKRMHGPGASMAKVVKTLFNTTCSRVLLQAMRALLQDRVWADIQPAAIAHLVQTTMTACNMGKNLEEFMKNSEKPSGAQVVVGNQPVLNRMAAHLLERKNPLNTLASVRGIVVKQASANKSTKQADYQRRLHHSFLGFKCPSHSPDTGVNVGMRSQLAITALVTSAGDSYLLEAHLRQDPAVEEVLDLQSPGFDFRVSVNGRWVGCVRDPLATVWRYRGLRRAGRLDPFATIYLDPLHQNVFFWLDSGRLIRPLLIVENNLPQYTAGLYAGQPVEFLQQLRLTPAQAHRAQVGELSISELGRLGVLEFISPDEQTNCLLAESADVLRQHEANVCRQFTHCDVPQAIFGITALVSPFGNHTQPARVTYCTNHGRQSAGLWCLNYPFMRAQNNFLMPAVQVPLVATLTNGLVPPAGVNAIVAVQTMEGQNQEDSAILNRDSLERGLFAGAFYRSIQVTLSEKNDSFQMPDPARTQRMRAESCYAKLVDGVVPIGTEVRTGDALVAAVTQQTGLAAGAQYTQYDRTEFYTSREPGTVDDVLRIPNPPTIIIKIRHWRPVVVGDKLSSRSGNKNIMATMLPESCMPFTETGLKPDMIVSTAGFPTRMANGQLMETHCAQNCAAQGAVMDGTMFVEPDLHAISLQMQAAGMRYNGKSRMYDGRTGRVFDAAIFIGPCYIQRLLKFILDDSQAVGGSAPTDAQTGQPVQGKAHQGGLRIGEMESWALLAHGAQQVLHEKLHTDSDGRTGVVCRTCGEYAVLNPDQSLYECRQCGEMADITAVESCVGSRLMRAELGGSCIKMSLALAPRQVEAYGDSPFAL